MYTIVYLMGNLRIFPVTPGALAQDLPSCETPRQNQTKIEEKLNNPTSEFY